jgi:hypothetical protein
MTRTACLAVLLSALLSVPPPLAAKDGPASQSLSIAVLQGENSINNTKSGAATAPIVEVRDDSMKPVAGAEVVFELPANGPGGTFAGGGATATSKTNAAGQAAAPQLTPNNREGHFFIQVNARLGERTGTTRIQQSNSATNFSAAPRLDRGGSKIWKVLGVVGGLGVTAGLIMLTRGGGSDNNSGGSTGGSGSTTITMSPGTITVGGPR